MFKASFFFFKSKAEFFSKNVFFVLFLCSYLFSNCQLAMLKIAAIVVHVFLGDLKHFF